MGLGKLVTTAIGLLMEMTVNVDTADGLVNGAGCITRQFEFKQGKTIPSTIWVEFDDPQIGMQLRSQCNHLYRDGIQQTWTPVTTITREFPVGKYKTAKVLRRQFPLQLAIAKTVHRCQGDSMKSAVIELPSQKKTHIHYVALSRVTNLKSVYSRNFCFCFLLKTNEYELF